MMKVIFRLDRLFSMLIISITLCSTLPANAQVLFRVNQVGYRSDDSKNAVIMSTELLKDLNYRIIGISGQIVHQGRLIRLIDPVCSYYLYSLDFSKIFKPGQFNIAIGSDISPPVNIGNGLYKPEISKALDFFKAQRCGNTSPSFHKSCHLSDATILVSGPDEGQALNLTGGWHDAGDYTKFLNTTAYSAYLMMLSYEIQPEAFNDKDVNGTPDILDEARIGLDWCMKAHYSPNQLVIQVQNKNDQTVGWRMPEDDPLAGKRPGYDKPSKAHCGIAAAALALGGYIFKKRGDIEYGERCLQHATQLYELAGRNIPISSCGPDSVYYDKTTWDNLALAAIELYRTTGDVKYLNDAKSHLEAQETVHWVSWGDLSGLALARTAPYNQESLDSLNSQLSYFDDLSKMETFGYPLESYPWGSASIQAGIAMLAVLHHNITGTGKFLPLAIKQRDFLLGMNSHGVSFISGVGLDFPRRLHHQISRIQDIVIPGGFAAGFVNVEMFQNSKIVLDGRDRFQEFQNGIYVYHDDYNDYLTNEASISNNAQLLLALTWFCQSLAGER